MTYVSEPYAVGTEAGRGGMERRSSQLAARVPYFVSASLDRDRDLSGRRDPKWGRKGRDDDGSHTSPLLGRAQVTWQRMQEHGKGKGDDNDNDDGNRIQAC